jgi:hypothetical protein
MAYCVDNSGQVGSTFTLSASQPAGASCTAVIFTGQEAMDLMVQDQPFDPTTAAGFWGFALVTVLFCWWTAKGVGVLLSLFRRD